MRIIDRLKPYVSNLILIWLAVYIYRNISYYSGFLNQQTQGIIFYFAVGYSIFGFLFYIFMPSGRIPQSKGLILFRAFKKILDKLLEPDMPNQVVQQPTNANALFVDTNPGLKKIRSGKKRKINKTLNKSNAELKAETEKRKRELAEKINRTEFQEIHKLPSALSKSFYILKIMRDKGKDGLTPPEISYILKEVFRIKASNQLVSVSLNKPEAHKYVDRNRIIIGKSVAYVYKLMKPGEEYLAGELKKLKDHVNKTGDKIEPD